MKKFAAILTFLFSALFPSLAQIDSTKLLALSRILDRYYDAIVLSPVEEKCAEMDFLISQCQDSITRQYVAQQIYSHYVEGPVMGEEAVAIHIYDKWFADGTVKMQNETDAINAAIFVDFNRLSMIGMDAPSIKMRKACGGRKTIPVEGHTSVLFFYDTDCSKCKAEVILLPSVMEETDFKLDFYAIYTGTDRKSWREWRKEKFNFHNPNVKVTHLWDPQRQSDFQRQYGILMTPKIFVVEPQKTIIGRRLELDSLAKILKMASVVQSEYDKYLKQDTGK